MLFGYLQRRRIHSHNVIGNYIQLTFWWLMPAGCVIKRDIRRFDKC